MSKRSVGMVTQGRNRLYQINPHFVVDKDSQTIDLGHCLLGLTRNN
jgi:hypothetical protein